MRFFSCFLFLFLPIAVVAQKQAPNEPKQKQVQYNMTKEELIAKQKEINDEINETQRQLDAIKNDKKATLSQLKALQNKLAQRQNLIATINDQVDNIGKDITSSAKEVNTLTNKLQTLKTRYAESIRYAYETRSSYDMLAFLFSSQDFNDAMRRMKYLKTFREFRKQQVEQIRTTQAQLEHKIGTLNAEKAQKEELVVSQEQQKKQLLNETNQKNQVIEDLKGREGELLKEIEKNRRVEANVNKAIQYYIEKEMAKKAEEEAKRKTAAATAKPPAENKTRKPAENEPAPDINRVYPKGKEPKPYVEPTLLTPTEETLASNFEGNQGKLYWPVEKGYITDHFGEHPHPLEPKVLVNNNGIDIQTTENANVRAVFEGTIFKVFSVTGSEWIVMISHGNYFTVYNGMASVSVKEGQHVNTKDVIGKVGKNEEDLPTINFQIWKSSGKKGNIKLNPESWISRAH